MSYAVFSDELCQDKVNAYAFNSANLEKVKEVTSVKTVLYGSDGAGSQLKNRYNLASLLYHKEDFNCKATQWSQMQKTSFKKPNNYAEKSKFYMILGL